jgi:hypothetical protein
MPPALASLTPTSRAGAAQKRAYTHAEGGQVEAVVRWRSCYELGSMQICNFYGAGYDNGSNGVLFSIGAG